jgi:hypothetical protein
VESDRADPLSACRKRERGFLIWSTANETRNDEDQDSKIGNSEDERKHREIGDAERQKKEMQIGNDEAA